jgi:glutamate-ammonia-ligase adenylyltransferase
MGFEDADRATALAQQLNLTHDVLVAVAQAAAPDRAIAALADIAEADPTLLPALQGDEQLRQRLTAVLGASAALGDHLIRHPGDWRLLAADADEPSVAQRPAFGNPRDADALRLAHRRGLLAIAGRDLTGELRLEDVAERLADLAADAIAAALEQAKAALPAEAAPVRFAVIGMGKCGARELNYSSDVDVIFVAEAMNDGRSDTDEHEALRTATKLAESVIGLCSSVTPEGALFPIDANLRPEGKQGPLVRTLASHEAYYHRWAHTWEYQALLKARPLAGDADLGRRYMALIRPMVWAASSRPNFVADVQAMRRRVIESLPRAEADREVKLGPGGLRDIEFAVQLLQLVHGRTDEAIRQAATLPALAALARGGYVGRVDAITLTAAYRFLRSVEHRLQLQRLRRTHVIPLEPFTLRWLARSLGFRDGPALEAERQRHAREVRRLHEKLFYRPLLSAVARLPESDFRIPGNGASDEELRLSERAAIARLSALGFAHPEAALGHLSALTRGVGRTAAVQRVLLPSMLASFADAADPDAGLLAYRRVSDALGRTPWYLRLLRDEGGVGPPVAGGTAERLARLLATSPYLADLLTRAPEAVRLLAGGDELRPRTRAELEVGLLAGVRRHEELGESWQETVQVARAARRLELFRVGCADLLGRLDVPAVGLALSASAEATLAAAYEIALGRVETERGYGPGELPARLAVIAMGRLGGSELGYGSDADVLYVHQPYAPDGAEPPTDSAAAAVAHDIAEAMRQMLALPGPELPLIIDAGLRPEGKHGPLTRSLASYEAYYHRWSLGWEAQALLRARPIVGDPGVGERFTALADRIRYPERLPAAAVAEVIRLRGRMERERVPRGTDRTLHLKLGPGGLTDVEWAAQLLQLRYGAEVASLRTSATLPVLAAAAEADLLSAEEAEILRSAWIATVHARNAVVLTTGRASDVLPAQGRPLVAVARVLGYGADGEGLLADHRERGRRARAVATDVFRRVGE